MLSRREVRLFTPPLRRPRHARHAGIRQVDIDFLCLSMFGQRSLPDEMAVRIALRRDFYLAIVGRDRLKKVPDGPRHG